MEEGKMHDTFLLKRISESLDKLCIENKFVRITKLKIITSMDSHIFRENLMEQLSANNIGTVGAWTEIIIDRREVDSLTAVIESVEGEVFEEHQ
jgi:hypothetical protein